MTTIGRLPPGEVDPSSLPPVPNTLRPYQQTSTHDINASDQQVLENYRKNPNHKPPDYLPQPEDLLTRKSKELLGPLDYWATGRTEYNPDDDLTGIRPTVDKYSITRFSMGEWRRQNKELLQKSVYEQDFCDRAEWNAMTSCENTRARTDKIQADNTKREVHREKQVYRWKAELEIAIELMMDEIEVMEKERQRLKRALMIVIRPASIAGECIYRRTARLEKDLVRDEVEDELAKELSLTSEIQLRLECVLREVERQLLEDRAAKQKMEYDWCEKRTAFELEATNVALGNTSTTILFNAGSATFPQEQSTVETWDKFVRDILSEAERIRHKSEELRGTLDATLMNAARDLRNQADVVEIALLKRIASTEAIQQQLDVEVRKIMRKIVDAEDLMPKIKEAIQRMDFPMKTAQTRLYNKSLRPRMENCRDPPQFGLLEEVKFINESVSELRARLRQMEESHCALLTVRGDLEREILTKRKTLEIDRDLVREVRTRYPSVNELSGYLDWIH